MPYFIFILSSFLPTGFVSNKRKIIFETAEKKFNQNSKIKFLCADAERYDFAEKFDCAVIYNAFSHFVDRKLLFENISKNLKTNGRLTVAHGMSREALPKHHSGSAKKVSTILPEPEELAELMKPYFDADLRISTDEIYIVSAKNVR